MDFQQSFPAIIYDLLKFEQNSVKQSSAKNNILGEFTQKHLAKEKTTQYSPTLCKNAAKTRTSLKENRNRTIRSMRSIRAAFKVAGDAARSCRFCRIRAEIMKIFLKTRKMRRPTVLLCQGSRQILIPRVTSWKTRAIRTV